MNLELLAIIARDVLKMESVSVHKPRSKSNDFDPVSFGKSQTKFIIAAKRHEWP